MRFPGSLKIDSNQRLQSRNRELTSLMLRRGMFNTRKSTFLLQEFITSRQDGTALRLKAQCPYAASSHQCAKRGMTLA